MPVIDLDPQQIHSKLQGPTKTLDQIEDPLETTMEANYDAIEQASVEITKTMNDLEAQLQFRDCFEQLTEEDLKLLHTINSESIQPLVEVSKRYKNAFDVNTNLGTMFPKLFNNILDLISSVLTLDIRLDEVIGVKVRRLVEKRVFKPAVDIQKDITKRILGHDNWEELSDLYRHALLHRPFTRVESRSYSRYKPPTAMTN